MRAHVTAFAACIALAAMPVLAHHSVSAEFDSTKPVTVTGTVTKLDWMNPHIWFYLDVKDANGNIVKWQFEGGPPNALQRNGVTRDALRKGDTVTVRGILAKKEMVDGVHTGSSQQVTFANGKSAFTRDARDDEK
jgi:Family of unknown function (DUF6152)